MKVIYKCSGCGREFLPDDKLYCDECGGIINKIVFHDNKPKILSSTKEKNHTEEEFLLIICGSCSNLFSRRAQKCPKCGYAPLKECLICKNKIRVDDIPCPECGDPTPFKGSQKKDPYRKYYSEKSTQKNKHIRKSLAAILGSLIFVTGLLCVGALRNVMTTDSLGAFPAIVFIVILIGSFKLARIVFCKIKGPTVYSESDRPTN